LDISNLVVITSSSESRTNGRALGEGGEGGGRLDDFLVVETMSVAQSGSMPFINSVKSRGGRQIGSNEGRGDEREGRRGGTGREGEGRQERRERERYM